MSPRTVNPLAWNAERRSSSCRTGAQRECRAPRKGGWSPSWPRRTALPQCTLCQHGAGGHFEEGPKVPRGPARSPRGIRWRPAVEGRLAAMAESAPARVRVLLARLGGAFGMAEPLAGAGLGVLGAAARAGEDRPPLATPGLCPPSSASGRSPQRHGTLAGKLLRLVACSWISDCPHTFLRLANREPVSRLGRWRGLETLGPGHWQ